VSDLSGNAGRPASAARWRKTRLIRTAIGNPARAFTAERDLGTLEALLLTPLEPREIIWSKFWARTAPLRMFTRPSAPIPVLLGGLFGYSVLFDRGDPDVAIPHPWPELRPLHADGRLGEKPRQLSRSGR
jgi:hypothetical protein